MKSRANNSIEKKQVILSNFDQFASSTVFSERTWPVLFRKVLRCDRLDG